MNDIKADVSLFPLQENDREQFIKDNQWAFRYGAQIEFGMRDDRTEEGKEVISRKTIEDSIDGENAKAYRIFLDGQKVGGVVLSIDKEAGKGELELLFVLPECHSRGIGQAAWNAVENLHPEIAHADVVAVGEAECKPRPDIGFVFHDAAGLAADVSRRLLYLEQQRFNLIKEVHIRCASGGF